MKRILVLALAALFSAAFAANAYSGDELAYMKHKRTSPAEAPAAEKAAEQPPAPEPAAKEKPVREKTPEGEFPEKGWHKGAYVATMVGMMQYAKDRHIVTDQKFDGSFGPAFGLAVGWDIADWIGPLLQINFSTSTGDIGDPNNAAAVTNYPSGEYPQYTFPIGTFPVESARQYALDFSIFAKATLPYFTRAEWQPKSVKIIPFAKLGATGHALFVNAPTNANKIGAFGGGPALGLGCEFYIWKGFYFALDFTEHLIIQKAYYRNINTANAGTQNLKLTKSGFNPHFTFAGMIGWHF